MKKKVKLVIIAVLLAVWAPIGREKLAAFYHNKGLRYYQQDLYDAAVVYFKKSLKIKPRLPRTHLILAHAYFKKKYFKEAEKEYRNALNIDPALTEAYLSLAQLYHYQEMNDKAVALLKQAKSVIPADSQGQLNGLLNKIVIKHVADHIDRAVDSFLEGRKEEAHALINKAHELNPDFAFTDYTLAYFYFSEGNLPKAEEIIKKTIDLNKDFYYGHKLLGGIFFREAKFEEAAGEYKKALSLNGKDAILLNDLGLVLIQIERYAEAMLYLQEASRLDPGNINIQHSLASVYRDCAMHDKAIEAYKKVISSYPDYPNIHNDLADIYKLQGRIEEAREEYRREKEYSEKKLSLGQKDASILNSLAYAFNGMGESRKAMEIISGVMRDNPESGRPYITLAAIYESMGEPQKSLEALEKGRSLLGRDFNFIQKDISRLKNELDLIRPPQNNLNDIIYLKNGRFLQGRVIEENEDQVIISVQAGSSAGNVTVKRAMIERIEQSEGREE